MRGIPGIVYLPKVADDRAAAVGKFMQVLFAEKYRARRPQFPDQLGIACRYPILEQGAGSRRAHTSGVDDVFQANGNSVQRTPPPASLNLGLRRARLLESRFASHGDESIQKRIEFLNSGETLLGQFHRRN